MRSRGTPHRARSALFVPLLAVSMAFVTAAAGAFLLRERAQLLAQARLKSQIQAQLLAEHAAGVFRQVELGLRNVLPLLGGAAAEGIPPAAAWGLQRQVLFLPGVSDACVLDPDGAPRFAVHPDRLPAFDPAPLVSLHGRQMVDSHVGSLPSDGTGPGWLTVSLRIDNDDGSFGGVLLAFIGTEYFTARFQGYRTVDVDLIALYDPQGRILASWTDVAGGEGAVADLRLLAGIPLDTLMGGGVRMAETPSTVVSVFQLPEFPLRIVLAYAKRTLLEPWWRLALAVGIVAGLLALTMLVSALWIRAVTERSVGAEVDLAASRAREDLLQVFRRVALLAGGTEDLRDFIREALREAGGFVGWPGALLHLRPSGSVTSGVPLTVASSADVPMLREAAARLETADLARFPPRPLPTCLSALAEVSAVPPEACPDPEAVLIAMGEPGFPRGCFLYLTGGHSAAPLLDLLEQVSSLIYRTAVQRLEVLEKQRLQEQLQHAQQLEGLATLAGGIAHEVNNLMAIVQGNAEMAADELGPAHPLVANLEDIRDAARRGGRLTEMMLATAGRVWMVPVPVDLFGFLKGLEPQIGTLLPAGTRSDFSLQGRSPSVRADPRLLTTGILKIVENSLESLPAGRGTISIRAGSRSYDRAGLNGFLFPERLEPGPYAWIEVRDDGAGMSRATLENLFHPFFSTKFAGRGLGLPAVLGIVRQHRGTMRVDSREGEGTAVTILLPCAETGS